MNSLKKLLKTGALLIPLIGITGCLTKDKKDEIIYDGNTSLGKTQVYYNKVIITKAGTTWTLLNFQARLDNSVLEDSAPYCVIVETPDGKKRIYKSNKFIDYDGRKYRIASWGSERAIAKWSKSLVRGKFHDMYLKVLSEFPDSLVSQ